MTGIELGKLGVRRGTPEGTAQDQAPAIDLSQHVGLPTSIPLEEQPAPSHSQISFTKRFPSCRIGKTSVIVETSETVQSAPGSAGDQGRGIVTISLSGPSSEARTVSVFNPATWRRNPDTSMSIQLVVGSTECPTWNHAAVCVEATKMALMLEGGYVTPRLQRALAANLPVLGSSPKPLAA